MGQSSAVFDSTLFLACRNLLVCKITDDYAAEQQIWRHLSAARHFCSAKILAGRAAMGGRGSSSQSRQSPRKEISRGNLLCAESGLTNLSYPRRLSAQKYVSTLNWYNRPYRAAWGARGAAPLCFRKSPEKTLPRVFFGQLLPGGSTRRFFAQLRSVGSNFTRLAGSCQFKLALAPR